MSKKNNSMDDVFNKVTGSAVLKHNDNDNNDVVKAINVYNVPRLWVNALKENGYTFAGFAKMAIHEKLKELKLI